MKTTSKEVQKLLPKPFSLKEHLDISKEAEKFEVPVPRVMEIMEEVEAASEPVLLTLKRHESELRDRFYALYNRELKKMRACPFCAEELDTIEVAITHIRLHLLLQKGDLRVAKVAGDAIEHQLFPQIEEQITAAIEGEERSKLVQRIRERRLLSD